MEWLVTKTKSMKKVIVIKTQFSTEKWFLYIINIYILHMKRISKQVTKHSWFECLERFTCKRHLLIFIISPQDELHKTWCDRFVDFPQTSRGRRRGRRGGVLSRTLWAGTASQWAATERLMLPPLWQLAWTRFSPAAFWWRLYFWPVIGSGGAELLATSCPMHHGHLREETCEHVLLHYALQTLEVQSPALTAICKCSNIGAHVAPTWSCCVCLNRLCDYVTQTSSTFILVSAGSENADFIRLQWGASDGPHITLIL